jgi:P-type E1-E2 ATPase
MKKILIIDDDRTLQKITSNFLRKEGFDVWGRWYAISVILLSGGIFLLFPLFSSLPFFGETGSISRAITFLITASPCALILAVPISYVSALGSLVRQGAILKGGIILDRLNRCGAIAFDKTGT